VIINNLFEIYFITLYASFKKDARENEVVTDKYKKQTGDM